MKDFYDIWFLARQYEFDSETLKKAIQLTFHKRESLIFSDCLFFKSDFIDKKQVQWQAFRKRLRQEHIPEQFNEIIAFLKLFLMPILQSLENTSVLKQQWNATYQWQ